MYTWKRSHVLWEFKEHRDCASFGHHLARIEPETKGRLKKEVLCDDMRPQGRCEVKVGSRDLKVLTLWAGLEAGEKQVTTWKPVNKKSERSLWRRHISEGIVRNVR